MKAGKNFAAEPPLARSIYEHGLPFEVKMPEQSTIVRKEIEEVKK